MGGSVEVVDKGKFNSNYDRGCGTKGTMNVDKNNMRNRKLGMGTGCSDDCEGKYYRMVLGMGRSGARGGGRVSRR